MPRPEYCNLDDPCTVARRPENNGQSFAGCADLPLGILNLRSVNQRAGSITVAPPILEVVMAARSSLDRRFVPFREPNSHRTRTEHVQNEEYFSVRREPATVMLIAHDAATGLPSVKR